VFTARYGLGLIQVKFLSRRVLHVISEGVLVMGHAAVT